MTLAAIWTLLSTAGLPAWLSIGGGASIVSGIIGAFWSTYRKYFIAAGLVGLVAASVGVTVWIMDLQATAEKYEALKDKNYQLSVDMGCPESEEVLSCFQRQQLELAEANANAQLKLMNDAAIEQERLGRALADKQAEVDDANAWREAHKMDNGALPKNVLDYYARLRARAGAK